VNTGPRRIGDAASVIADSALARRELAWVPRHDDLERIVSDALSWEAMLTRKNSPSR
jgi:UDP-glucose 4-epimerase